MLLLQSVPSVVVVILAGQVGTKIFNTGTTIVTDTLTDASGNTRTGSFTVTLVDNITPAITCPYSVVTNTTRPNCVAYVTVPEPSFSDNCNVKSLTWTLTGAYNLTSAPAGIRLVGIKPLNVGTTVVRYTVKDNSGNTNSCSFNITVNSTNPCGQTAQKVASAPPPPSSEGLQLKLAPNPTTASFVLRVQSAKTEPIEITVYSSDGRKIEQLKRTPFQTISFGDRYVRGTYLIEVRQGEKRATVTGVKQ